jgi:phosphohistidine phosphatase
MRAGSLLVRRLLLLRHAKAVPAEEAFADIARPLAERGERDARRIGERLRQRHRPKLILASPATRTLQTAQLVAAALDYPRDAIALDPKLYLAERSSIVEVIAGQDAALESLLIVGHNPGLTQAVHQLRPGFHVEDLPTAAIVVLEYAALENWGDVETATSRLVYYDFPKNPHEPATAR